ncbi:MAG: PAS domain S-box protein [Deferrisomatales bacterium]
MPPDPNGLLGRLEDLVEQVRGAARDDLGALAPALQRGGRALLELARGPGETPGPEAQSLRERAERLRELFEAMGEGFALHELLCDDLGRPSDYRFLAVNPAFEVQTGLRAAQVVGRTVREVLPGIEPEWIERYGRVALTGEPARFESYSAPLDRWYEVRAYRTEPGRFAAVFLDVTERKRAELERYQFVALADHSADFIGMCDLEFNPFYVNPAGLALVGLDSLEQAQATRVEEFLLPEDRQPLFETFLPRVAQEGRGEIELRFRHFKTGAVLRMACNVFLLKDAEGRPAALATVGRDITERWRAEAALRASEQRLKRAQEIAHLGSWELEVTDHRLTWSDEAYRIFGHEPQAFEATYEAFLAAVHPDDRAAVDAAYSGSLRENRDTYEIEHRVVRRGTGEVRFVHEKCEHFRDASGRIVRSVGMVHDITERRQAEDSLRESESFYHQTLESIPGMVFTTRPDGYCDYQSRPWVEFTGVPMEEHLGDGWNRLLHPDDRPRAYAAWRAAVEGCAPYDLEYRVRRHDGAYEWFKVRARPILDGEGRIVRWFGTALNIDRLVQAREGLRESRERFRLLSETAGRLLVSDDPQGLVEDLCRSVMARLDCQVFFNFLVDEPAGRLRLNAWAGIPEADARSIEWLDYGQAVCGCVARDRERIVAEDVPSIVDPRTELIAALGVQAYCCHPLMAQGRLLGTLSFGTRTRPRFDDDEIELMRTVTDQVATAIERVRTQQALQEAVAAADAANRAKSEFLARMSHEIRTPLNGVLGMTDLALRDGVSPRAERYLGHARQSALGLLDIINDLLDLAKIEVGRVELTEARFEPRRLLESVVSTLGVAAHEKGVSLVHRVHEAVPQWLMGDDGRLRQVLVNVIGNAVKFTERGQVEVAVGLEAQAAPSPVPSGCVRVRVAVRDTGIGIPPENLCAIFDSFSQATRSTHVRFGGTGLGLAIAKQLVELMGGEIWAESEVGRGSTFHFTVGLRCPEGAEPEVQPEVPAPQVPAPRPLRVLVAEDNAVNQLLVRALLEREGHAVTVTSSGRQALEALAGGGFDGVLMDVQMPEMDGLEATRRIRRGEVPGVPPDLPIVALTAHAVQGDRERFLAAGMDDHVSKPLSPASLSAALARWHPRPAAGAAEEAPAGGEEGLPEVEERLRDWLERLPPPRVWELVDLFRKQLPVQIAAVADARGAGDAPGLAAASHTLRGSAVCFGTQRMAELCAELEAAAKAGSLEGAAAGVAALERELRRLDGYLEQARGGAGGSGVPGQGPGRPAGR